MTKRLSAVLFRKTLWLFSLMLFVACGGSDPEPIAQPVQEEVAPVVVADSDPEPTIVVASPVPPTAIPTDAPSPTNTPDPVIEPTDVVEEVVDVVETVKEEVAAEPVVEETFDPDAEFAPPDFDAILASGKPFFINSYADW